jgi:hypothetical protein
MTDQPRPADPDVPTPPDGDGRPQLGRILVDAGLVDTADLASVLEQQKETNEPLGRLLVEGGYVAGHSIALALAQQHKGPLKTEYGFATPSISAPSQSAGDLQASPPPLDPPRSPEPEPLAPLRTVEPLAPLRTVEPLVPLQVAPAPLEPVAAPEPVPAPEPVAAAPEPVAAAAANVEQYEQLARELDERDAATRVQLEELEGRVASLSLEHREALASIEAFRERAEGLQRRVDDDVQRLEEAAAAIERLEAELAAERERPVAPATPTAHVHTDDGHVVFLASNDGYRLIERAGPAPLVDEVVELPDAPGSYRVTGLGASPFPGDRGRCAYLELLL